MGFDDKIKNAAQEGVGKAKEAFGDLTNNQSLEAEGQREQAEAQANKAGEHVKDAAKDAGDAFKN